MSLAATIALAVPTIASGVLAASGGDLGVPELALGAFSTVTYGVALVHFWRDWWVRTYLGPPDISEFRSLAAIEGIEPEQIRWAAAASLEQIIVVNDRHIAARVSAFKLVWTLVPLATVVFGAAIIAHLAQRL